MWWRLRVGVRVRKQIPRWLFVEEFSRLLGGELTLEDFYFNIVGEATGFPDSTWRDLTLDRQRALYWHVLMCSKGLVLPHSKGETRVLIDESTLPDRSDDPETWATAQCLRDLVKDELARCGIRRSLTAAIISGNPLATADRWHSWRWRDLLEEKATPSASGAMLRPTYAQRMVRYVLRGKPLLLKLCTRDPVARDCLVISLPPPDAPPEDSLIRVSAVAWELMQGVLVRFRGLEASRVLSSRIRRRLCAIGAPRLDHDQIVACCALLQEIFTAQLQLHAWPWTIEAYDALLSEVSRPEYVPFARPFLVFQVLALAVQFEERGTPLPATIVTKVAKLICVRTEDLSRVLSLFGKAYRGFRFLDDDVRSLTECVYALAILPELMPALEAGAGYARFQ
jgi:hypothetical protein